jgi:hypothetical protein
VFEHLEITDPRHKQWAMQWTSASAALQAIRDEELRTLDRLLALRAGLKH